MPAALLLVDRGPTRQEKSPAGRQPARPLVRRDDARVDGAVHSRDHGPCLCPSRCGDRGSAPPALENLAAVAELLEEFDVWGLTTELPVANLPSFDHLDKTMKALERIYSKDSKRALAQVLRPVIESLTHNSHRQDAVVQMQAHAIVATHEFCTDHATQASVGDLLDAFSRQFGGRGLGVLQKASGVWVCDFHAKINGGAAQATASLSPLAEAED
ncbi:Aste57867_6995 [Aphanomyces stellatus]|uniref:Aste57867_3676 protein n=1 Tax=Aphanomyces stellatus TaxID=120398 RepID=A0A485KA62_9STRA|nr:hypothetical protein As57867_006972 [Aphanomyces stellatus]KAF0714800.1 hypothetical protein As57867_003665 [Aphanomyces stellatus]VFT80831.1 Aste57867_3676 [Aphanomyces stellatus]VFT83946.1 Aste57867_6995 [Aphanomyces stellatus]